MKNLKTLEDAIDFINECPVGFAMIGYYRQAGEILVKEVQRLQKYSAEQDTWLVDLTQRLDAAEAKCAALDNYWLGRITELANTVKEK